MMSRHRLRQVVEHSWYGRPLTLLRPLAGLFGAVVALRRVAYNRGWLRSQRLSAPVIVVGNIAAGGSGKTPFTLWLVKLLQDHGYRPAVLSRGYGAQAGLRPLRVAPDGDAAVCGDEPLLIAQRTGAPVYIDADRARAGRAAIADAQANVLVCDDGLQYYRLRRDIEIALVDGERRVGNGQLLPAGPLREPVSRLAEVDFVVLKGHGEAGETVMRFSDFRLRRLCDGVEFAPAAFAGRTIHAVAGIAAPSSFFTELRRLGMSVIEHPLPDHHPIGPRDLHFGDDLPVVMTEKDAVKCPAFADPRYHALSFTVDLDAAFAAQLLERLTHGQETARHPGMSPV